MASRLQQVETEEIRAVLKLISLKDTAEETCDEANEQIETILLYYGYSDEPKPSDFNGEDDWSSFVYLGMSKEGEGKIKAKNEQASVVKIKPGDYVPYSRILSVKQKFIVYLHHVAGAGHGYQCKIMYAEDM